LNTFADEKFTPGGGEFLIGKSVQYAQSAIQGVKK